MYGSGTLRFFLKFNC